jgi:hypothetical protein
MAAIEPVGAAAAIDPVVAIAAVHRIDAVEAVERVVPAVAEEVVSGIGGGELFREIGAVFVRHDLSNRRLRR